jgi:hypothetical protein
VDGHTLAVNTSLERSSLLVSNDVNSRVSLGGANSSYIRFYSVEIFIDYIIVVRGLRDKKRGKKREKGKEKR